MIDARPGINAYSTERGQTWYIAVKPDFFSGLSEVEQTGVLGHESAHLIYRHVGKAQEYESELAADEWAGWLLHRCGISERESSSLWGKLGGATASHPGSHFRIEAAIKGWRLGEAQDRDMLGALAGKVRSMEEEMSQLAEQTAKLRSEKDRLDRDLSDALAAKRWSMIAGAGAAALALMMGAWLFLAPKRS